MKHVVIVDSAELQQAVLAMVLRRPSSQGKFVAAVYLIADPDEKRTERRIRCEVVMFDTTEQAQKFSQAPEPAQPPATTPPGEHDGKSTPNVA